MCVCVCVCVCVCARAGACVCAGACVRMCVHSRNIMCIHVYVSVRAYASAYMHVSVCDLGEHRCGYGYRLYGSLKAHVIFQHAAWSGVSCE